MTSRTSISTLPVLVLAFAFTPNCATNASAVDGVDVQKLLTANACMGCHAIDKKIFGPGLS